MFQAELIASISSSSSLFPILRLRYPLSHSVQPRQKKTACHSCLFLHHQPQHPLSCASNQHYLVEWLLCTWHCPEAWDITVNKQSKTTPTLKKLIFWQGRKIINSKHKKIKFTEVNKMTGKDRIQVHAGEVGHNFKQRDHSKLRLQGGIGAKI